MLFLSALPPRLIDERLDHRLQTRIQLQALIEVALRLGVLAFEQAREAAIGVGARLIRIDGDGLIEIGDGFSETTQTLPRIAAIVIGHRHSRVDFNGARVIGNRAFEIPQLLSRVAAIEQALDEAWVQLQCAIVIELKMRRELPPREKLIPPGAELFSQTGVVGLWRERIEERHAEPGERFYDRSCVGGLEFFGGASLADRRFAKIDRIVLPEITKEETSRLEPIPRSEALLQLAQQSMFFQLWPQRTEEQWRALVGLAAESLCHRFFAGRDLLSDPRLLPISGNG
jgi:hypothetical protein